MSSFWGPLQPSIYDLVRKVAGKQLIEDLTTERIRNWIDNWQLVFILDGFDEVRPADRDKFVEWVIEMNEVVKGCPFVITSRPLTTNHLKSLGPDWQFWNIEPFDEERIIAYITKWYASTPLLANTNREINGAELAQSWLGDPTLGPLTSNPLLLSTLLMVHHLDGKLPNGRGNLYKRYVDGMLGVWDDRHKLLVTDVQLNPLEKRKIIQGIALNMFLTEQETIDENLLLEWLETFLPKINIGASAVDTLAVLRERSGLIVGPGIYSFTHKTIAEFLVAEAVLQGDQQDKLGHRIDRFHLFEHRNDDRWNTVLFLWAGMTPFIDMNAFIDECVREENWSLVFGLFDDQYDRFSQEARKEIYRKLKTISNQYRWADTNFGFRLTSGDLILVNITDLDLRGLTSYLTLIPLLFRAVESNDINWEEFSTFRGKAYDLVWFAFATRTDDLKKWLSILQKPPRRFELSSWKKYIAHLICHRYLNFEFSPDTARSFISVYLQVYPDHEGYLVFSLVNYVNLLLGFFEEDKFIIGNDKYLARKLNLALDMLLEQSIDKIIDFVVHHREEKLDGGRYHPTRSTLGLVSTSIKLLSNSKDPDPIKKENVLQFLNNLQKELRSVL